MAYTLTRDGLVLDLHAAYQCAKRHKVSKYYVRHFERCLKENIEALADELTARTYKPEPSSCFVVEKPKKREVFAAQFRDRIVHHLYFNYVHGMFERTFINDTYSCIVGRGTHYGIARLKKHILSESMNYTRECYVMKIDIRGYFMHINRRKLLSIATDSLTKMASRPVSNKSGLKWHDVIDMNFVLWLTEQIIMLNPQTHCKVIGTEDAWKGIDFAKLLRYAPSGCGLPIGNLTSQLLSNVYLNIFDQYMKRILRCRHYGRYVDDAFVVCADKEWLFSLIPQIREFLLTELGLELHMGKLKIVRADKGVEFLGAFIKPYRTYVSRSSLKRMARSCEDIQKKDAADVLHSVNSILGILAHYNSYNIRCGLFLNERMLSVGTFDPQFTKMQLND